MTLNLGIDDAGRGPIIGPMIVSGVLLKKSDESYLKKLGVTDSKLLSHQRRIELSKKIKEVAVDFHIIKISPKEIDEAIISGFNLNNLEANKMAEVVNKINSSSEEINVVVDCPSINTLKWGNSFISFIKKKDNLKISCEHKADLNHISAAAASILSKVTREEEVMKIKKKFGDIGSGYPADPITKKFLNENGLSLGDKEIIRKSWATWKNLFPGETLNEKSSGQSRLGDF